MASAVPLVREYAYVWLRFKMAMEQNSFTSSTILCRYGDTNDVFPNGGLVDIGETHIAAGSRYCRLIINFVVKPHDHLCLFQVLKGLTHLMSVRISLYILDVKAECLIMLYKTLHNASE
jgi:hypothetical protein